MGLETATYINDLVSANPLSTDAVSQGDDHLRLIKQVLKNSFPNLSKPISKWRVEAISANETVVPADDATLYYVDASGGARTIALPAASTNAGLLIGVKKADSSANSVIIDPDSSELVDGAATLVLTNRYDTVWVLCDGTGWLVVVNAKGTSGSTAPTYKVRCGARGNINRATAMSNGQSFDGVTLATGDLILLTGQTAPADNGIYLVPASGTSNRAPGFTTWDSLLGAVVLVVEGTSNGDTVWRNKSGLAGTIGTTAITFSELLTVDNFTVVEPDLSRDDYLLGINGATGLTRLVDVGDLPNVRVLHCRDIKAAGSSAGTGSSGMNIRTLNDVVFNSIPSANVGSNRITLPEGTYTIFATIPSNMSGKSASHSSKVYLYNVTDATNVIYGSQWTAGNGSDFNEGQSQANVMTIRGVFSITATKSFEIRHWMGGSSRGLGQAADLNGMPEVYTEVIITKVE